MKIKKTSSILLMLIGTALIIFIGPQCKGALMGGIIFSFGILNAE